MKVLIIDPYYEDFLHKFYQNSAARSASYDQNKQMLFDHLFGTANFYSINLQKLGHKATEIIANDKTLQTKWAKENGINRAFDFADNWHIPFSKIGFKSNWQTEILESQIIEFNPDVIFCQNLSFPGSEFLKKIKRVTKSYIVGQIAYPTIFTKEFLSAYDLILSSFPHFVSHFHGLGINSEYFRIGFEQSVLGKAKKNKKPYEVSFVGAFTKHHDNTAVLAAATDVWGHGLVPASPKYHPHQVWGIDMYNVLYNSKITLNRHSDLAENHANNMRLYEATGVGTMLITDYKSDLHKLFRPGIEVETYKSQQELESKVKYYLSHEKERQKIAAAGQKRTLKDHTYEIRMQELNRILKKYL